MLSPPDLSRRPSDPLSHSQKTRNHGLVLDASTSAFKLLTPQRSHHQQGWFRPCHLSAAPSMASRGPGSEPRLRRHRTGGLPPLQGGEGLAGVWVVLPSTERLRQYPNTVTQCETSGRTVLHRGGQQAAGHSQDDGAATGAQGGTGLTARPPRPLRSHTSLQMRPLLLSPEPRSPARTSQAGKQCDCGDTDKKPPTCNETKWSHTRFQPLRVRRTRFTWNAVTPC